MDLMKQSVLKFWRRHVVQRREHEDRRKPSLVKWQRRRVGADHVDIGFIESRREGRSYLRVNLRGRELGNSSSKDIGGESWPWSYLQYVVSQVIGTKCPGQQIVLDVLGPLGARAYLHVLFVHTQHSHVDLYERSTLHI
jgi:hypothetical protein